MPAIRSSVDLPGVVPLQLDITDPASVARAAELAADATLLINNAGILTHTRLTDGDLDQIRLEMDTGIFGTLAVTRAFAPVLAANGGGCDPQRAAPILSWPTSPRRRRQRRQGGGVGADQCRAARSSRRSASR